MLISECYVRSVQYYEEIKYKLKFCSRIKNNTDNARITQQLGACE
jgi:hypothetical protein